MKKIYFLLGSAVLLGGCVATVSPQREYVSTSYGVSVVETAPVITHYYARVSNPPRLRPVARPTHHPHPPKHHTTVYQPARPHAPNVHRPTTHHFGQPRTPNVERPTTPARTPAPQQKPAGQRPPAQQHTARR